MKYCVKCGNPMDDDMVFCQKCGTRYEDITKADVIKKKIEQMKKYNLTIYASAISWKYVNEDEERSAKIIAKQSELLEDFRSIIRDVLDNLSDDEDKESYESDIYIYVLNMGQTMCKEAEKMFYDYREYGPYFTNANDPTNTGQVSSLNVLERTIRADDLYKAVAGVQGVCASEIASELDENVIRENEYFCKLTLDLAQAFNNMFKACVIRYRNFSSAPKESFIDTNWNLYKNIIKGLPQSYADQLDESAWDLAVMLVATFYNNDNICAKYRNRRERIKEDRIARDQKAADEKYWKSHPEELKKTTENQTRIKENKSEISNVKNEITSLEQNKRLLGRKKSDVEDHILESKQEVEKLGKKIFGRKKAEETIQTFNRDIDNANQELQHLEEEIKNTEKLIADKKLEKEELEKEITRLEEENHLLRNK